MRVLTHVFAELKKEKKQSVRLVQEAADGKNSVAEVAVAAAAAAVARWRDGRTDDFCQPASWPDTIRCM